MESVNQGMVEKNVVDKTVNEISKQVEQKDEVKPEETPVRVEEVGSEEKKELVENGKQEGEGDIGLNEQAKERDVALEEKESKPEEKKEPVVVIEADKENQQPEEPVVEQEEQFNQDELAISVRPSEQRVFEEGQNRVFVYGSAECDQFYINEEVFESRRPVEVPYFLQNPIKIIKISCGAQHTAILTQEGKVLTWGNSDSGCLGREVTGESTVPGYVDLSQPVDIISSGECHTICANSLRGEYTFWGTMKSTLTGKLFTEKLPKTTNDYRIKRGGIADLKSGYNHVVLLTKSRVYTWGDNDTGALGIMSRSQKRKENPEEPAAIKTKNVRRIFVGGNHTFVIDKKDKVYGFGLNNHGQLGLPNLEDQTKYDEPELIPGLNGKWIVDIIGGEHHTLIVMKNGWVFGAGRNDDGQLGNLSDTVKIGGFRKLVHLPAVADVKASNHFNYAETCDRNNQYSWGLGFSYVLANGKEDTLEEARQVNNEKFFKQGYPSELQLGHSHVVFTVNQKGDENTLQEEIKKFREKMRPIRRKRTTKKMR